MSYTDRILVCRDCGKNFIFTAGEQEFYSQKGFLNDPVRCPECRRARKKTRQGNDTRQEGRSRGNHHTGNNPESSHRH